MNVAFEFLDVWNVPFTSGGNVFCCNQKIELRNTYYKDLRIVCLYTQNKPSATFVSFWQAWCKIRIGASKCGGISSAWNYIGNKCKCKTSPFRMSHNIRALTANVLPAKYKQNAKIRFIFRFDVPNCVKWCVHVDRKRCTDIRSQRGPLHLYRMQISLLLSNLAAIAVAASSI